MTAKQKNNVYVACAVALIAVVTGVYFIGRSQGKMDNEQVKTEIEKLKKSEADAAIVTRVSQQMEEIAYQQKIISDQQRDRAEQQSELAMQMRDKAEYEKTLARQAEEHAVKSAEEASRQRQVAIQQQKLAEEQRDQANYARRVSDTLSYKALGRTLGYSATVRQESGDSEMAGLLAYASWYFLDKYKGNTYQSESFKALVACSGVQRGYTVQKSGGVNSMCSVGNGYAVVSDYGEVEVRDAKGNLVSALVQDQEYDFRDVVAAGGTVYALSVHGPVVVCGIGRKTSTVNLPEDSYMSLEEIGDDRLLAIGKRRLVTIDCKSASVTGSMDVGSEISAAVGTEKGTLIFLASGKWKMLDAEGRLTDVKTSVKDPVTAACHDAAGRRLFLGHKNGGIEVVSEDYTGNTVLRGHIGKVLDLICVDDILVSSSYDKNILVWNLGQLRLSGSESLTPADLKLSEGWPLCLLHVKDNDIAAGFSDGQVFHTCISASEMAAAILKKTSRNLTLDEWRSHIGISVPYETFK